MTATNGEEEQGMAWWPMLAAAAAGLIPAALKARFRKQAAEAEEHASVAGQMDAVQKRLLLLEQRIEIKDGQVAALEVRIDAKDAEISGLRDRLDHKDQQIDAQAAQIATQDKQISTLQSEVLDKSARIRVLEASVCPDAGKP